MEKSRAQGHPHERSIAGDDLHGDPSSLARQYGQEYFTHYGRGPHQFQAPAPYRHGEPIWEGYFGRIADLICSELAPRSVLDAGCAIGFLVRALRERNVEAWGIDFSEYAIARVHEAVRAFCSVKSVTDELDRDYDLIVCTEVLEHLPPELAAPVVANFSRHTSSVLFSASPDVFRDPTHLNVQPTDYWVELFGRQGFFRNLDVDASVVAPQAVHFVRAGQTAVSVARAYERWHWASLAELRDLRQARQSAAEEFARAERAAAETESLRVELERHEASIKSMEARSEELEHFKAAAERAQSELLLLRRTRTFRYTALARRVYGRLRRSWRWSVPRDGTSSAGFEEVVQPGIRFAVDEPREGQRVASDLVVDVRGWAICDDAVTARVDVSVNGFGYGKARLGIARPDVASRHRRADAIISGFEAVLELGSLDLKDARAQIGISVASAAGKTHDLGVTEVLLPSAVEDLAGAGSSARGVSRPVASTLAPAAALRVLAFTHHLGLGGGQLYLFELLRLLSRSPDFRATLMAPEDGPLRPRTEALGIPVVVDAQHPIASIDQYEARQEQLAGWVRERDFNIVLANTLGTFPAVDLAARLELPSVWAIHESFSLPSFWRAAYGPPGAVHPLVRARAEAAFASAGAVVFEADATRELFVRLGDPRRFVTVPYGIDVEAIDGYAASVSRSDARRRLRLPQDATILLCLGTIEPRKGQAMLAEAFESVAKAHPEAVLVFVGARLDASSRALGQFVRQIGLSSRVKIVRVTPEINLWYRAADALVSASDVESLPRTALEAMAFSVPVIATSVFGLPELIDDGVTGYLCQPNDVGELSRMLERFLGATAEERRRIGEAGAALVRERHDSRGYASAYERLLRGLVETPGRLPSEILAGG